MDDKTWIGIGAGRVTGELFSTLVGIDEAKRESSSRTDEYGGLRATREFCTIAYRCP